MSVVAYRQGGLHTRGYKLSLYLIYQIQKISSYCPHWIYKTGYIYRPVQHWQERQSFANNLVSSAVETKAIHFSSGLKVQDKFERNRWGQSDSDQRITELADSAPHHGFQDPKKIAFKFCPQIIFFLLDVISNSIFWGFQINGWQFSMHWRCAYGVACTVINFNRGDLSENPVRRSERWRIVSNYTGTYHQRRHVQTSYQWHGSFFSSRKSKKSNKKLSP